MCIAQCVLYYALQMAFASLQQAISLDPLDFVAYLKLGTLYEQLATTAGT
jgi:hypothetical protein